MEYLTEAIPGSISSLLGNVEGLDMRAPITNAEFETVKGDLTKVAALYKVQNFVQSFVTVESDQMTLNVQLLDSKTRRILWSHDYPGHRRNYLELVRGTAEDLRKKLLPDSKPLASASGLAANSETVHLLQRGKYYTNRYYLIHDPADFDRAYAVLKDALKIDPKLAEAAAAMAWLHIHKQGWNVGEDTSESAEAWARRAIEIDQRCGRAWSALSILEQDSVRPQDKSKQLEYALKAVQFAPRDPDSFLALGSAPMPIELGLYPALEAYRLDSLDLTNGNCIGDTLFLLGRSSEGLPYLDSVLSIEPDFTYALYWKVLLLADLGRIDEAARVLLKVQEALPGQDLFPDFVLPCVLALQREDSTAVDRLLREIINRINEPKAASGYVGGVAVQLLSFAVRHGRMEAALAVLERYADVEKIPIYDMLVLDPRLEPLRRDARFTPLLEKYRENCVESMKVLAQARSRGELPRYLEAPFDDLLKKLEIKL